MAKSSRHHTPTNHPRVREVGRSADMCSYMLRCLVVTDKWLPDDSMYDGWGPPVKQVADAVSRSRRLGKSRLVTEADFDELMVANATPTWFWTLCVEFGVQPNVYGHGVFQVRWMSDGQAQFRRVIHLRPKGQDRDPITPYDNGSHWRLYSRWQVMPALVPIDNGGKSVPIPLWQFDLTSFGFGVMTLGSEEEARL